MKQYLTRAQMRELAEIDIDTRQLATHECTENGITYFSLSIGDLIEMLPRKMNTRTGVPRALNIYAPEHDNTWLVYYPFNIHIRNELIDALFDMVVRLKKEGKI